MCVDYLEVEVTGNDISCMYIHVYTLTVAHMLSVALSHTNTHTHSLLHSLVATFGLNDDPYIEVTEDDTGIRLCVGLRPPFRACPVEFPVNFYLSIQSYSDNAGNHVYCLMCYIHYIHVHLQRPQLTLVAQLTTIAYLSGFLLVAPTHVSVFLSLMI